MEGHFERLDTSQNVLRYQNFVFLMIAYVCRVRRELTTDRSAAFRPGLNGRKTHFRRASLSFNASLLDV